MLLEYGGEADRVDTPLSAQAAQVVPHQVLHYALGHHAALTQVLHKQNGGINQSIYQSNNHLVGQSIHRPINQSITQ
jgi:hypothetical protein